ncbi:hypothetical protein DAC20_71 [Bacteroides phage DAC20]|jgi:hypothetical protein|nr:hypothetical protein DAC16_71 [Bacteroides phage DAC16]QIG63563.1 hypothetical protein DAC19_72 [Bacteroides phage DAC19]QIG63824.1 hypothetical protein DAC20_71 [Bacteroides phage DAC20]QIG64086.1 hypothetical protein DAC22_72 [Bacteroides phage DAC22]QIG64349.1 hypothetical protein DAC23_71 [Bacteroides phage DAC23]QIG64740.1 hypothetical protein SJC03_62 [Bacteroides phage SJC03]
MDIYFIRYKLEDKVDSTLINLDRETIIRDNLFAFKNAVSKQNKDILPSQVEILNINKL